MRSLLVAATFLLSVLLYVDRVCISAAKKDVAADLVLSDQEMGWCLPRIPLDTLCFRHPAVG